LWAHRARHPWQLPPRRLGRPDGLASWFGTVRYDIPRTNGPFRGTALTKMMAEPPNGGPHTGSNLVPE
ncbi:MAG: hypothetical protein ACC726_11180, partial [Chloroflexota bacterium]